MMSVMWRSHEHPLHTGLATHVDVEVRWYHDMSAAASLAMCFVRYVHGIVYGDTADARVMEAFQSPAMSALHPSSRPPGR
jgi:hypothetical protein